eukprot:scaffold182561_cov36-Tisochrysis_lutea.AAC.4
MDSHIYQAWNRCGQADLVGKLSKCHIAMVVLPTRITRGGPFFILGNDTDRFPRLAAVRQLHKRSLTMLATWTAGLGPWRSRFANPVVE